MILRVFFQSKGLWGSMRTVSTGGSHEKCRFIFSAEELPLQMEMMGGERGAYITIHNFIYIPAFQTSFKE